MLSITYISVPWALLSLMVLSAPSEAQPADCIVNPAVTVKVGSPIASTLSRVDIERGVRVTKGQMIAQLESGVEAADLALAQARANGTSEIDRARSREELAGLDLKRGEALLLNHNVPQQKVDELRSNLRVAQQERITAELNKHLAEMEFSRSQALFMQRIIRSPVDGLVTQRLLAPGEYVHQDNQIAVIAVTNPLHVEAFLPVRLWSALHPGDTVPVRLTVPAGRVETATVTVVDQVFDAASGTFGVRLELPNAAGALPAGQRCRLDLPAALTE